jgi:hypothetical protein
MIRDYGDNRHLILHLETSHQPSLKFVWKHCYTKAKKIIAIDYAFLFKGKVDKKKLVAKLEKELNVKFTEI